MTFALSTRWNSRRHSDGGQMVDEILAAGFSRIELGYDLRRDLVDGIRSRVRDQSVQVVSVHNYCPVPMGVPRGHPEIWTLAHSDPAVRRQAVEHTAESARLAAELGAGTLVVHAGYVEMRAISPRLIRLAEKNRLESWWGRRLVAALDRKRERLAPRHLDWLVESLKRLVPALEECGVNLGLENLPSWEAVPSEREFSSLVDRVGSDRIRYWHDIGHGAIRECMGWIAHERLLERLKPWLVGMHIHDVRFPARDHVLPGEGNLDFSVFADYSRLPIPLVLEPEREVSAEALKTACDFLRTVWVGRPAPDAVRKRVSLYDAMPARVARVSPPEGFR
ncbi:MAG: sugar phosphate isomerase/epimerase family protein [Kiritimatiellia bacterium]|nr:sugar phosphate isomerase/epimerase family protein [Kiritimatiellia bacterium]